MFSENADELREQQLEHQSAERANYVPYNNVPMGVTHYHDRLFVTVPRRRPGIPATLNYISSKAPPHSSPTFRAYPNYQTNELPSTGHAAAPRLVSVYRTRVDRCNRLWFVDTGLLEYPSEYIYHHTITVFFVFGFIYFILSIGEQINKNLLLCMS